METTRLDFVRQFTQDVSFDLAECVLAVVLEDLGYRLFCAVLDEVVHIDEWEFEKFGCSDTAEGLSSSGEADEVNVAVRFHSKQRHRHAELLVRGDVRVVVFDASRQWSRRRTSLGKRRLRTSAIMALADWAGTSDLTDVGAVVCGFDYFAGVDVDAGQRGRVMVAMGFDSDVDDDGVAVGHATFDAAGVIGQLSETSRIGGIWHDNVVHIPAPSSSIVEAVSDLDALDGVDAGHGLGESTVEFAVPHDVAAESDGYTEGDDLHHAADGCAFLLGGVDRSAVSFVGVGIPSPDFRGFDGFPIDFRRVDGWRFLGSAADDMGTDIDVELF